VSRARADAPRARRYGTSKAALNFVARKLRAENPGLGASLCVPAAREGALTAPCSMHPDLPGHGRDRHECVWRAPFRGRGRLTCAAGAPVRETMGEMMEKLKIEWKTPVETGRHVLARIDEATHETDAFVQWDGTTWPW
jgi:hypothetical protein